MNKSILLIDDDIDMCRLLNRYLSMNGYKIEVSYSGLQGIEKFKSGEFDIVLCDYSLGDKKGSEVLQEIKAFRDDAIVLIITGFSDIKNAIDLIKAGAYDYITKPLVPEELLKAINAAAEGFYNKFNSQDLAKKATSTFLAPHFYESGNMYQRL